MLPVRHFFAALAVMFIIAVVGVCVNVAMLFILGEGGREGGGAGSGREVPSAGGGGAVQSSVGQRSLLALHLVLGPRAQPRTCRLALLRPQGTTTATAAAPTVTTTRMGTPTAMRRGM